ncbi:MAG: transglycosylase domain-containing protein [Anaerolineaceae bacterium]|nr:transglycosylase domain-containing protein [Anaerolineaceae bacterium]
MRPSQLFLLVNRRSRRQNRRQQSFSHRLGQGGLGCSAVFGLLLVAAVFAAGAVYASLTYDLPSTSQLPILLDQNKGLLLQPTLFYDRSGQHLLYQLENQGISRHFLALNPDVPDHFSPQLVQTTITMMDPSFWSSPGLDWSKLTSNQPATLAERVVDELLLNTEAPSLRRAIRMHLLAAQIVANYGHSQILEWYLNSAYYGHLAYGADSAARLYFGKPASQLNLAESVMLVVTSQAPALNPLDAPAAAREREQAALYQLLVKRSIGPTEFQDAHSVNFHFNQPAQSSSSQAAAFIHLVSSQLSEQFGQARLEQGGLRIITTLDYDLQNQLVCTANTQLLRLIGNPASSSKAAGQSCDTARLLPTLPPSTQPLPAILQISGLVLDPQSGQVLALIGDDGKNGESPLLTGHQAGSLLTPFIALAGFARGMGPASLVWDIPASAASDSSIPQNPDGKYHGPQRLRMALANDYLVPFSQILNEVGAFNVWHLAEPLGLTGLTGSTNLQGLLYSGGSLNILQIAQAYSTFANLGTQTGQSVDSSNDLHPSLFLRLEDTSGRTLLDEEQPQARSLLSPQLAYLIHNILSDESARWPSLGFPNPLEIGRPAGAKIGQVQTGQEVWAVGYTKQRLAAIWLGFPTGSAATSIQLDPKSAAGVWHAIMQYANQDQPSADWSTPAGIDTITVCDPSGLLPTADCPTTVSEIFINGDDPTTPDSLYKVFQINSETGRLATVFTPLELVQDRTFMVVPPEAQDWAKSAGLSLAPTDYDAIQPPLPSPDVQITSPALFGYVHGKINIIGTASGSSFASYRLQVGQGLNPSNWVQIGSSSSQPIQDDLLAAWDTRGLDGLYAMRLLVVQKDQHIQSATIQLTVDNTPPDTQINYPAPNQQFQTSTDAQITLQAQANDAIGVAKLEWYLDGERIGQNEQAPYNLVWQTAAGQHTLLVKAYDLAGNVTNSSPVSFTVQK